MSNVQEVTDQTFDAQVLKSDKPTMSFNWLSKCKVSIVPMIIQFFQQQGMKFCFGPLLLIYTLLGQLYG